MGFMHLRVIQTETSSIQFPLSHIQQQNIFGDSDKNDKKCDYFDGKTRRSNAANTDSSSTIHAGLVLRQGYIPETRHENRKKISPFKTCKTMYFLRVRGLRVSFYIVYDYTSSEYIYIYIYIYMYYFFWRNSPQWARASSLTLFLGLNICTITTIYIYIYIYMCVCVCVCVYIYTYIYISVQYIY